ncbi:MAG: superinfection immunity protein [Clostridia bacterium]
MEDGYIILVLLLCVIGGIAGIVIYFLPSVIAYNRGHKNRGIILLINFLFSWTFVGWAGCLVWAFIDTDGSTASKITRNFGGNKYEDLASVQKLKEDETITDAEFEIEKTKLLNRIILNKYEKIQKLQTLKENGTITDAEIEIEKAKVLNENNNQNKKNHFGIIILCAIVIILGSGIVANIIISNNAKKLGSNYESSNEYSNNIDASNKYASKIKNKWGKSFLGNNTNNLKCAVFMKPTRHSLYLQY